MKITKIIADSFRSAYSREVPADPRKWHKWNVFLWPVRTIDGKWTNGIVWRRLTIKNKWEYRIVPETLEDFLDKQW